jgi:hypothetical protein
MASGRRWPNDSQRASSEAARWRQMGESILERRGVNKLTRMAVHGGWTRAEGHVSARSDGSLPASTAGSESIAALGRSSGRRRGSQLVARGGAILRRPRRRKEAAAARRLEHCSRWTAARSWGTPQRLWRVPLSTARPAAVGSGACGVVASSGAERSRAATCEMGTTSEEEKNRFASAGVQEVRWRGWRRTCGRRDRGRPLENDERRRWPRSGGYLSECARAVREVGRVGQADSAEAVYYSHGLGPLAFFFILSIFQITKQIQTYKILN